MQYQYATEKVNYEDYAAGRVFYNKPGATSFPVRLASEIFQRACTILQKRGVTPPYHVYDPCCGTGYLLTTLGFLHSNHIKLLSGGDIDADVVPFARRNLSLLTPAGMQTRMAQLRQLANEHGKTSHEQALKSAENLLEQLNAMQPPKTAAYIADAARRPTHINQPADILICDMPYERNTSWVISQVGESELDRDTEIQQIAAIQRVLWAQRFILADHAIVVIIADKEQFVSYVDYKRHKRLTLGKRQILFLSPQNA